jgi:hypothetical protein
MSTFFIMINHEESADTATSLEEARIKGQAICDNEIIPCTFSIYQDETFVEDIRRTDGLALGDLVTDFNKIFGSRS